MTEHPIPFQGAMVRALLAGTKTQTRRVLKPHAGDDCFVVVNEGFGWRPWRSDDGESGVYTDRKGNWMEAPIACPYGQPGHRLWVREAWRTTKQWDLQPPRDLAGVPAWYEADLRADEESNVFMGKLRPSMFMPRWASRITLEITGVRVERLQDISEADAKAEGATPIPDPCDHVRLACADIGCTGPQPYRAGFRALWESMNGQDSWAANPWVWVVEFKQVQP